jgi:glycosyltransferase involved in cell wall biosynthesis
VLSENYSDFEHIIVDGGSTDNTIETLKKYPHLIWVSEPDNGQSDALNKGFKMATGDVIGWLNSDDYYLPGIFEKVAKEFNNSEIDAVYGNYMFIDGNGRITKKMKTIKPVRWLSLFTCYIPSTTFFFKREIIENKIFIDVDFHISMDKEFFAHILFSGYKIRKIEGTLSAFRWHESNKSTDSKEIRNLIAKEGLIILSRYGGIYLKPTDFNVFIYKSVTAVVDNIRKIKARINC